MPHQDTPHTDQSHQDTPIQPHNDTTSNHVDRLGEGGHRDFGGHTDSPVTPHNDRVHLDTPHQDSGGQSPPVNQAAGRSFAFDVSNHQAQGHGGHVIYLVGEVDKSKNQLYVTVQNVSGSAFTFQTTDALELRMGDVLPPEAIHRMTVAAVGGGWQLQQHSVHGRVKGYDLRPSTGFTWARKQTITFTLTNIYFTPEDTLPSNDQGDFILSFETPSSGEQRAKIFLLPWHQQPKMLRHFEAAFCPIPRDAGWNVRVDQTNIWLPNKDEDVVFSNAIADMDIRSRLAFRLTNKDFKDPLTLDTSSSFKISFLEGENGGELATSQNLVNNLSISELNTNDWELTQASDEDSPAWTLTPKQTITLAPHGGTYEFLIDSVFANGVPTSNARGADFTEMYLQYSNIPAREGSGHYDDDYLAATIEKVTPTSHFIAHFLEGTTLDYQGPAVSTYYGMEFETLTIEQVTLDLHVDGTAMIGFRIHAEHNSAVPVQMSGQWFLTLEGSSMKRMAIYCEGPTPTTVPFGFHGANAIHLQFRNLFLLVDILISHQGDLSFATVVDASVDFNAEVDGQNLGGGSFGFVQNGELWSFA